MNPCINWIYKLEKLSLPFLVPLIQNEYTVTDSFNFAEEICKQDANLYMASLDVDFLFTGRNHFIGQNH